MEITLSALEPSSMMVKCDPRHAAVTTNKKAHHWFRRLADGIHEAIIYPTSDVFKVRFSEPREDLFAQDLQPWVDTAASGSTAVCSRCCAALSHSGLYAAGPAHSELTVRQTLFASMKISSSSSTFHEQFGVVRPEEEQT